MITFVCFVCLSRGRMVALWAGGLSGRVKIIVIYLVKLFDKLTNAAYTISVGWGA